MLFDNEFGVHFAFSYSQNCSLFLMVHCSSFFSVVFLFCTPFFPIVSNYNSRSKKSNTQQSLNWVPNNDIENLRERCQWLIVSYCCTQCTTSRFFVMHALLMNFSFNKIEIVFGGVKTRFCFVLSEQLLHREREQKRWKFKVAYQMFKFIKQKQRTNELNETKKKYQ